MGWTELTDVTDRWPRPLAGARQVWVETLIGDAEDELTRLVDDLPGRVVDVAPDGPPLLPGQVPLARVKRTVAAAVIRVLRNPEGYTQFSRTTGPFSESATRAPDTGAGQITFTDEELDSLRAPAPKPARSIQLAVPGWRIP